MALQGEVQRRLIAYIGSPNYMCPWPNLPPQSWTNMLSDSEYMQKLAFIGDSRLGLFVTQRLLNGVQDASVAYMSVGRGVLCSNATFEHIRLKANGGPLIFTSTRASGTVFEAVAETIYRQNGESGFTSWGLKTFLPLVHEFRKTFDALISLQSSVPRSLRPLDKGNCEAPEPMINTGVQLTEREFIELSQLSIDEQDIRARRCADRILQQMIDEAEEQCLPSPSPSLSKEIWAQAVSDFCVAVREYTERIRKSPLISQAGFIARENRPTKCLKLPPSQEKKKKPRRSRAARRKRKAAKRQQTKEGKRQ